METMHYHRPASVADAVKLAGQHGDDKILAGGQSTLPSVRWQAETPYGRIVVDTTGRDNAYELVDPLLVVDVGGDDRYEFRTRGAHRRVCVLLDHGGDDRYIARSPGADASAAILGYGILWDTGGDDQYEGTTLAQGAALFGASLVVDGGGPSSLNLAAITPCVFGDYLYMGNMIHMHISMMNLKGADIIRLDARCAIA